MLNLQLILALVGIATCLAALAPANVDDNGCPIGVQHKCEFCSEDGSRYGCYCELPDGTGFVTASISTPCVTEATVKPCDTHTCQNNAGCVQTSLTEFKCNCTSGFGGALCNETLPKCTDANVKCINGECVETGHADLPIYCKCFDGTRRDPRQNDTACPPSPCYEAGTTTPVCQNSGTCQIFNNAAVCQCTEAFGGQTCNKPLKTPLCSATPNVCGIGKCQQSFTPPFYSCNCGTFPSTFGKNLSDLIACEQSGCYHQNPCQNGGTCSNKAGGTFLCQCSPRYTGFRCEKQSACFTNPCRNQGTCQAFNETVYFCVCPPYFTGKQCEVAVPNPCVGKNCGPYGVCQDSAGVALCKCSNGLQSDPILCEDPCLKLNCNGGVCLRRANATYEAYCACPTNRKGPTCALPNDICREKPSCGGGYCKPNYATVRGYSCICEGGIQKNEPCPFSPKCPLNTCGAKGICVQTDGLIVPPATLPIHYVCSCVDGYIASANCDTLIDTIVPAYNDKCGNGTAYPSRNPNNPVGCWCNNGTHVPEIYSDTVKPVCV